MAHIVFNEIKKRVPMTEDDWSRIEPFFTFSTITKRETLVTQGRPCDKAFFIQKGLLYSYRIIESGESQVVQFGQDHNWFGDLHSFLTGKDALFSLEAGVNIFRIKDSKLAGHWEVLQEEVPAGMTPSKNPMFPIQ